MDLKVGAIVAQLTENGSTERHEAVENVSKLFSTQKLNKKDAVYKEELNIFSPMGQTALWRALLYSLWLEDGPISQHELCRKIANVLLHIKDTDTAITFLKIFWAQVSEEWLKIDKYRIDKLYSLMRMMLEASLKLCANRKWKFETVQKWSEEMTDILIPRNKAIPLGIPLHIIDCFMNELCEVLNINSNQADENEFRSIINKKKIPISLLIKPFVDLSNLGHSSVLRKKAKSFLNHQYLKSFLDQKSISKESSEETGKDFTILNDLEDFKRKRASTKITKIRKKSIAKLQKQVKISDER